MFRTAIIALALTSAPALASSHYHAEPAAAPAKARFVARDIVWKCGDSACTGAQGNSRPQIICAAVVKELGALKSFTVAGAPLAAEELEKCNARAN